MQTLLDRKLIVITGKGGVGKTTIAAALGRVAAKRGRRTLIVEVGQEHRLPLLFGSEPAQEGSECVLGERLSSVTIDPDRALLEWLQMLGGRVSGRVLASSGTFQYFAAAAPGARELVTMVKVWRMTGGGQTRARAGTHDLVVLDAPATGHALGLLGSPRTFGAIARVGPIAGHTRQVQELLESPSQSAYLAVALGTEMAVTEALELQQGLRAQLGRGLEAVLVNQLLPRRFNSEELERIAALAPDAGSEEGHDPGQPSGEDTHGAEPGGVQRRAAIASAAAAARTVHDRARFQQNQLARLRRREFDVWGIPFVWGAELDLAGVVEISARLERKL
jgi:anion-transporting  ArsA/GET3 family ATPase